MLTKCYFSKIMYYYFILDGNGKLYANKIDSTEYVAVYIVDTCLVHIQHTVEEITVQKKFW